MLILTCCRCDLLSSSCCTFTALILSLGFFGSPSWFAVLVGASCCVVSFLLLLALPSWIVSSSVLDDACALSVAVVVVGLFVAVSVGGSVRCLFIPSVVSVPCSSLAECLVPVVVVSPVVVSVPFVVVFACGTSGNGGSRKAG